MLVAVEVLLTTVTMRLELVELAVVELVIQDQVVLMELLEQLTLEVVVDQDTDLEIQEPVEVEW